MRGTLDSRAVLGFAFRFSFSASSPRSRYTAFMSRMASSQYEIGRVAERCHVSGSPLGPGAAFIAALFETDAGSLERRDFTPEAWGALAEKKGLFASWKGVVPQPDKPGRTVIDAGSMLGLFEQLGEMDDPKRLAFRYVLALILLRKRMLLPAGMAKPGILPVRMRGSSPEDPPIEVIDPAMDESTVLEITEQLRSLLRIEP